MKKLTNWELSNDIVKKALCAVRLIAEIETLKTQAGSRAKKYIDIYDCQFELIKSSNWANHEAKGAKWFFRTFNKGYLTNFNDRLTDDITVLSEYQESLIEVINSNEYHDYEIFENNILVDGGEFKNMDDAITAVQFCDHIKRGRYYKIVGNNETATFLYSDDGKFEEIEVNDNDTIEAKSWKDTLIDDAKTWDEGMSNEYYTDKIKVLYHTFMKLPYRYTFKTRGYSIGCQPMAGLKEVIVNTSHKFEILEYDRPLNKMEIDEYELIPLD